MDYGKTLEKVYTEFSIYQQAHKNLIMSRDNLLLHLFILENEIIKKYDDCKIVLYFDSSPDTTKARKNINDLRSLIKDYKGKVLFSILAGESINHGA